MKQQWVIDYHKNNAVDNAVKFGKHIKKIRLSHRMTLRQVEQETNNDVSNAYLSQIEHGKVKSINANIISALAYVYDEFYPDLMIRAGYNNHVYAIMVKESQKVGGV